MYGIHASRRATKHGQDSRNPSQQSRIRAACQNRIRAQPGYGQRQNGGGQVGHAELPHNRIPQPHGNRGTGNYGLELE